MANTIGTAYIQIEPTTKGIAGSISNALSGEAESAGSKAGGILSSALGKAAGIGVAAIGGATAAMGAFGKASIDAGMQFDSAMSQVAATMGFSTTELNDATSEAAQSFQQLRDFAQEMGSTTAFSASEAADALNYMALAGYDAETSMEMLPTVLSLAAAGGIDLANASDMVTDAQSALGLSIEETKTMVDQMAMASSKSNTSVAQLGEAFLTVGANAKGLSGGTQELSQVLGLLADNGIKGAEGGTHLRNIMLALNPTTDKAVAAWSQLGVSAYDAQGNLKPLSQTFTELNRAMDGMTDQEKSNILTSMFNKTDLASVNALLGTTTDRWYELNTAIGGATVDVGSFKEAVKDVGLDFDDLQANIDALGDANLTGQLGDYLKWAAGDAEKLARAMEEDSDATITYDDIVNALGGDLSKIQTAFDNTAGAAQTMADTQLDNLTGDITLFQSALEGAKIAVSDGLTPVFRDFVQIGSEGLSNITEAFKNDGIEGAMTALGDTLTQLLNKVVEMLPEMIDAGMQLLEALGKGILQNLPTIIKTGLEIIVNLAKSIGDSLPELIPTIVDVVIEITETLIDNVDLLLDGAIALIIGLAEGLINALPRLIEKLPELVMKITTGIINSAPKLVEASIKLILTLQKGILDNIPKLIQAIPQLITALKNAFIKQLSAMVTIGSDLVNGIKQGIKQAWESLTSWLSSLCGNLVDIVKRALKIGSPSKIFRDEVGQWIPAGIAVGIEGNTDVLEDSMDIMQNALDPSQLDVSKTYATNYNNNSDNNGVMDLLNQYLPQLANMQIMLDSGALVGATAPAMNSALGMISAREGYR